MSDGKTKQKGGGRSRPAAGQSGSKTAQAPSETASAGARAVPVEPEPTSAAPMPVEAASSTCASAAWRFRFGPLPAPIGATQVTAASVFSEDAGFGWVGLRGLRDVDRGESAGAMRSFVLGALPATFKVKLPPGVYACTAVIGDAKGLARETSIGIAGMPDALLCAHTAGNAIAIATLGCQVEQGPLAIALSPGNDHWVLVSLDIRPAAAVPPARVISQRRATDRWALPPEGPDGPHALLSRWRASLVGAPEPPATGLGRTNYLSVIDGCVTFFRSLQAESGAIIDPYKKVEFQYSTPCFAYAAALLAAEADRTDLLEPALRAFGFAARALSERSAADGHEDFYPAPLAHAYRLLAGRVPGAELDRLAKPLSAFDPYTTYRKKPGGSGLSGSNWNCKALAGHYMLIRLGLRGEDGYVVHSLLGQGQLFNNQYGLYAEGPMTYDAFPRAWLGNMLAWGYDGARSAELRDALWRGAVTSLFMQSPTGELPIGGRSSHHQWSDALQCTIFERAAAEAADAGDLDLAGTFKRAARRALGAMLPWRRPSGEFFVVKNRLDPALRHGFESYSSHSQYNLLAAAALGFAYELTPAGSDRIAERWTPAERGIGLLHVESGIHKLFGVAGGTQVEVATKPTPRQTPLGLIRVHMLGLPALLPVSDGLPHNPLFELPDPPPGGVAVGLAWPTARGVARSLDGVLLGSLATSRPGEGAVSVDGVSLGNDSVAFQIRYNLTDDGPLAIVEHYEVSPGRVAVTFEAFGGEQSFLLLRWPVFAGDGAVESSIDVAANCISVALGSAMAEFRVAGASGLKVGQALEPVRNGFIRIAEATLASSRIRLEITWHGAHG